MTSKLRERSVASPACYYSVQITTRYYLVQIIGATCEFALSVG